MGYVLHTYNCFPYKNRANQVGNRVTIWFEEYDTPIEPGHVPRIDWGSITMQWKYDGESNWEDIITGGQVVNRYLRTATLAPVNQGVGSFGTGQEETGNCWARGVAHWKVRPSFARGEKVWIHFAFDDIYGNSFDETYWFQVAARTTVPLPKFTYEGTHMLGPTPSGRDTTLTATMWWCKGTTIWNNAYEVWIDPIYVPDDITAHIQIDDGTWKPLSSLIVDKNWMQNTAHTLKFRISPEVAETRWDRIEVTFRAVGYAHTGCFRTNREGTGGLAFMDTYYLTLAGYFMSRETVNYYNSIGVSII
ncbi:MAG: hypothetical protein DRP85_04195 [Candidatus Makaraimicrobium thalassicum]|nr:MAG: hypothetical protein DRP85_04195 [Candidatus Omnitrophota bacterium]